MKKRWMVLLVACVFLYGCTPSIKQHEKTAFALDTVVTVTVYEDVSDAVFDGCFDELKRLESLFSATRNESDIARINAANGQPVTVSPETVDLLQVAAQVSAKSGGAFDMTVRPVTKLWQFTADNPTVPDAAALQAACEKVDYRRVTVQDTTVTVNGELEPGGIAKGYIADCLAEWLVQQGVTSALLDLGGNIVAVGDKGGEAFRVGIKDPQNAGALAAILRVSNCSVVTSGTYERAFMQNGVRYHHLLDPQTGMPVQNGLASVSIVTESSALADALSTACFVMGETAARDMLKDMPHVQALFIYEDGTMSMTDGFVKTDDGEYAIVC